MSTSMLYCAYMFLSACVYVDPPLHPWGETKLAVMCDLRDASLCLSRDKWVMKMWYLYTVEFCSAPKKN